jgi:hypothetical protein
MRTLEVALFAFALAAAAFASGSGPASAIATQAAVSSRTSDVTLAEFSRRCRRWHQICEERHALSRIKYRGCMAVHGCAS